MGIIHTPRTFFAVARGFWNRSSNAKRPHAVAGSNSTAQAAVVPAGIGSAHPHLYTARMGVFDVDYLGHMNNASYLSHAEYSRWQMCAENGLISAMWSHNIHFVVLGSSIRYRKELRPLFRSFCIETTISAIDDANMWIVHNFRHHNDDKNKRIMTQVLVQGAAIQGRTRVDPAELLIQHVGIDKAVVDALRLSSSSSSTESLTDDEMMIQKYMALQQSMQECASNDDSKHVTK
jgi:acyl-CoA thioesterase FadM